jgi:hypothetical protein
MTTKSANGVEGQLIYTATGKYMFRVYDKDHNFVDYDLAHSDLCVTINDSDAFLYQDGGRNVLDHSPETLGIKDD